jgi:hypothetical protein
MRILCFTLTLVLTATSASADEYWITYEGNDFPENQGWRRVHGAIPAQRWIEDGKLFIDSRASVSIFDFVKMTFNGTLDPDPGELFLMRWRLKVGEVNGFADPGISVTSDELYAVGLRYSEHFVFSSFEPGLFAEFEPGVFHQYELRSPDMRVYELYIDDTLAFEGMFYEQLLPTRVAWGDVFSGATSITQWDYVRFGVAPEPGSGLLVSFGLLAWRNLR